MLIKILGGFDVVAGILLLFGAGNVFPKSLFLFFGMVLTAKSFLGFFQDFASWVDFLSGVVFLFLSIITLPFFISAIFGILLLQKGVFSFL